MTIAEQRLWLALREAGLPWKVRRQHPIGIYIADFAIPACRLVIELDGGQHATQEENDAMRSASLRRYGYRVLRFWNNEVINDLDGVLEAIDRALSAEDEPSHERVSCSQPKKPSLPPEERVG